MWLSPTSLTCVAPAGLGGGKDVRVALAGQQSADGNAAFSYAPPIVVSASLIPAAGGWLEVEMLGGGGRPLSGLSRRDCDAVRGNTTARTVTWNGDEDCGRAAGHDVRLRFHMRSTRLYAFQFTP